MGFLEETTVAKIRGNSIAALNSWIVQQLKDQYPDFISDMRPQVARTLLAPQEWEWYPVEYLKEVYEDITRRMGSGDNAAVLDQLGNFLAEADIENFPVSDLALLPMPRVLARVPGVWARYKNCGDFEVLSVDADRNSAELMLTECGSGLEHRKVITAWLEKLVGFMCQCRIEVQTQSYPWEDGGDAYYWKLKWK